VKPGLGQTHWTGAGNCPVLGKSGRPVVEMGQILDDVGTILQDSCRAEERVQGREHSGLRSFGADGAMMEQLEVAGWTEEEEHLRQGETVEVLLTPSEAP